MTTAVPIPGDPVYLGSFLTNTHWYGVVGDGDTPAMQVATMEAVNNDAVIALDVLRGDKGAKGDPADIVKLQYDSDIDAPSQLPTASAANGFSRPLVLADAGMAWWIGNLVYMWTGTRYIAKQMGSKGEVGETPHPTFTFERVAPGSGTSWVQTGTSLNPTVHVKLDPPGRSRRARCGHHRRAGLRQHAAADQRPGGHVERSQRQVGAQRFRR